MSTESSVRDHIPGPLVLFRDYVPQELDSLSLYIHIPFCESRCRYCNFYFETGWSSRVLGRTLDAILEESRTFRSLIFPRPGFTSIKTIYMGGGTPSVIPPLVLEEFLGALRAIWQPDPAALEEFAFEANPESLSPGHLEVFPRAGITRLSLGVQTWDDRILSILGRKARSTDIDRCLDLLGTGKMQGTWKGKVNLDLMVGLPGQTMIELDRDLDRMLDYVPDHVSVYTLTVEERTPLHRLLDDPELPELDDQEAEALWLHADRRLAEAGLVNYEVSNFARPGCESRHNMAYWRLNPYLGLGPGAVSTLPCLLKDSQGGEKGWIRLTNPHTFAYSRPGRPGWEHATELLGRREFLLEHFITGLRIQEGLDLAKAESRIGLKTGTLAQVLAPLCMDWEKKGLSLPLTDRTLRLSKEGRLILNLLLEEIMDRLDTLHL